MTNEIATVDLGTGEIVDPTDPVQQGRDAWARIKDTGRKLREDWLILAAALDVGRQQFITESGGLNKKAFGQWCEREGFGDLDARERSDTLWLLDNRDSIFGIPEIRNTNPTDIRKAYRRLTNETSINQQTQNGIDQPSEETCTVDDLAALSESDVRFSCIYADPPWLYGNQGTRAATGNHYTGMTVDEIAALPVADLTTENAHLHLWTTNAFLPDSFRIMDAWGFDYKSVYVWVKPQMGIGNYWRVSHEFMLFGVKGKCPFLNRSQMSWGQFDRTIHSAKPEEIRRIIEKTSPGPRLEMFGRRVVPGWTVWGNQITRTMFDDEVRNIA
ncbi:MAG: MT-A70 family methyltransferase [Candidatus Thiodiazotropha sp.]